MSKYQLHHLNQFITTLTSNTHLLVWYNFNCYCPVSRGEIKLIKNFLLTLIHDFLVTSILDSYCNDCRDLDLSRDSALLIPSQEWHCRVPQCGQPYDRRVMENALLQIVRQRERLYHMQDLVCLRCNQVKAAHLSEQCNCAGSYTCREDESEFRSKMQIFLKVAECQKFQLLHECTSWILQVRWCFMGCSAEDIETGDSQIDLFPEPLKAARADPYRVGEAMNPKE